MVARLDNAGLRTLLDSPNWRAFERSLAAGMCVSLTICRGQERVLSPGSCCPWCTIDAAGQGECVGYVPRRLAVVGEPIVVACQRGTPHAVCHLAGEQILDVVYLGPVAGTATGRSDSRLPEITLADLRAKAKSARTIIAGLVMAYFAATAWGRHGPEMAAIQEISRTIASLHRFGNPELDKALDLILNSLLILPDADACWLETSDGLVMTRGVPLNQGSQSSRDSLAPDGFLEKPIGKDGELGRLGVHCPKDREWAEAVLSHLVSQVQTVLEVDRLHRRSRPHL